MIYIYTGPLQSGKTTALATWADGRDDIAGFLTPDRDGRRVLRWLNDGREVEFELAPGDARPSVQVGRFHFSEATFARARAYLAEVAPAETARWMIVDELGRLELRGRGFEPALGNLIQRIKSVPDKNLLLVVRDSLVGQVRRRYDLYDAPLLTAPPRMPIGGPGAVGVLTALWALTEAGLGGLLHLIRSPFTGLLVGGFAVILIALLAHFSGGRPGRVILRALGVVLVVKALASPQSPPAAYLAVAFQGLLGAGLFSVLPSFRLAAFLLGLLALTESALQKILVLTLLFGQALWEAVEALVGSVTVPLGAYVTVYAAAGAGVGWVAGRFPGRLERRMAEVRTLRVPKLTAPAPKKPLLWRKLRLPLFLILFLLSVYLWQPGVLNGRTYFGVVVRVGLALVMYYFLLGPLVRWLVVKWGTKGGGRAGDTLARWPRLRALGQVAWRDSSHRRGLGRLTEAAERWIAYALREL